MTFWIHQRTETATLNLERKQKERDIADLCLPEAEASKTLNWSI